MDTAPVCRTVCLFTPQLMLVLSYTVWWQKQMCVEDLPKYALGSAAAGNEPAISNRRSNTLTTVLRSHVLTAGFVRWRGLYVLDSASLDGRLATATLSEARQTVCGWSSLFHLSYYLIMTIECGCRRHPGGQTDARTSDRDRNAPGRMTRSRDNPLYTIERHRRPDLTPTDAGDVGDAADVKFRRQPDIRITPPKLI